MKRKDSWAFLYEMDRLLEDVVFDDAYWRRVHAWGKRDWNQHDRSEPGVYVRPMLEAIDEPRGLGWDDPNWEYYPTCDTRVYSPRCWATDLVDEETPGLRCESTGEEGFDGLCRRHHCEIVSGQTYAPDWGGVDVVLVVFDELEEMDQERIAALFVELVPRSEAEET